ncbi:MAG: hypothetical protein E6R04_09765 [Spirochaetes bacterium]|nr:MAG: hypothetical protein E6R04_09765 [Spirochaetota bacterium]
MDKLQSSSSLAGEKIVVPNLQDVVQHATFPHSEVKMIRTNTHELYSLRELHPMAIAIAVSMNKTVVAVPINRLKLTPTAWAARIVCLTPR